MTHIRRIGLTSAFASMVIGVSVCPGLPSHGVMPSIVLVSSSRARGTGFICDFDGKRYLVTNAHVLEAASNLTFTLSNGKTLTEFETLELADSEDLIRMRLKDQTLSALPLGDGDPAIGSAVRVYGNSLGVGVATETEGLVQGVGPTRIEVSASFVSGNSGSPIVTTDGRVIGVATYVTKDPATWVTRGTRFEEVRRFGIRLGGKSNIKWVATSWTDLRRQSTLLDDAISLYLDLQPFAALDPRESGLAPRQDVAVGSPFGSKTSKAIRQHTHQRYTLAANWSKSVSNLYATANASQLSVAADFRQVPRGLRTDHEVQVARSKARSELRFLRKESGQALRGVSWITTRYADQAQVIRDALDAIGTHLDEILD